MKGKGAKKRSEGPKRIRLTLKTKKALPKPNPTAPSRCFYLKNGRECPSDLTPHKGVCDEGKRPAKRGEKRPATAADRGMDTQKKDGVGAKEQDEVEAHRDARAGEEAEPIDDGDERVRQALHSALQPEGNGSASGQRDPHEGRGDEQRGGQREEEIGEEENEGGAAEIVATEREGADLCGQADGHESPGDRDPATLHVEQSGDAGRKQEDEKDGREGELETDVEEAERIDKEHQQSGRGQRVVGVDPTADGHAGEVARQHRGRPDGRRGEARHGGVGPGDEDHQSAAEESAGRSRRQEAEQQGEYTADEADVEAADG